jgi:hypothetical protein
LVSFSGKKGEKIPKLKLWNCLGGGGVGVVVVEWNFQIQFR